MAKAKQDTAPAPRTADKFVVRLPDGMRDLLHTRAQDNVLSANSFIIAALAKELGLLTDAEGNSLVPPGMLVGSQSPTWIPRIGELVATNEGEKAIAGTIEGFSLVDKSNGVLRSNIQVKLLPLGASKPKTYLLTDLVSV